MSYSFVVRRFNLTIGKKAIFTSLHPIIYIDFQLVIRVVVKYDR